jgi:Beta-propeller repeat/Bacterial TSP3 repeat
MKNKGFYKKSFALFSLFTGLILVSVLGGNLSLVTDSNIYSLNDVKSADTHLDYPFGLNISSTGMNQECEWSDVEYGPNGYIYTVGYARPDAYYAKILAKYDKLGNQIWNATWNQTQIDKGTAITVDNSGNVYTTGYFWNTSRGNMDLLVAKWSIIGQSIWNATYDMGANEYGMDILLHPNGFLYTAGYIQSENADLLYSKWYPNNGTMVWTKLFNKFNEDFGYSIAIDDNGDLYTGGKGDIELLLVKWDPNGNQIWNYSQRFTPYYPTGYDIVCDGTNVYQTGILGRSSSPYTQDVFLVKHSTTGSLEWNRTWGTVAGDDQGLGVALDDQGDLFVVGDSDSYVSAARESILMKYDTSGNLIWNNSWSHSFNTENKIVTAPGSTLILCGKSQANFASPNSDLTITILSTDTDNDNITSYEELKLGTDPNKADTDGDTLNDYYEGQIGTNPILNDTDRDLMLDGWEHNNSLNPLVNDSSADPDGDGVANLPEFYAGTNPNLDDYAPVLSLLVVPDNATQGENISVSISVYDPHLQNVTLYYQVKHPDSPSSAANSTNTTVVPWSKLTLNLTTGLNYSANISTASIPGPFNITGYISAKDSLSNVANSSTFTVNVTKAKSTPDGPTTSADEPEVPGYPLVPILLISVGAVVVISLKKPKNHREK